MGTGGLGLLWSVAGTPRGQSRWGSGRGVQPLGLVESLREAGNGGLDSRVQRAKGGGISIPGFLREKGTRGWDSCVLGRSLEVQTPVSGEGSQGQKLKKREEEVEQTPQS